MPHPAEELEAVSFDIISHATALHEHKVGRFFLSYQITNISESIDTSVRINAKSSGLIPLEADGGNIVYGPVPRGYFMVLWTLWHNTAADLNVVGEAFSG